MDNDRMFELLFAGNPKAYGDGGEGGGRRNSPPPFSLHLSGKRPIGIYTNRGDDTCRWGCSDIDTGDLNAAINLHKALEAMGFSPWVESSRSKGYHVWLFANEWVPCAAMRGTFLVAHQALDYPPKEVNPKQNSVQGERYKGYGNYVRLPYIGRAPDENGKRTMLWAPDFTEPVPYESWVPMAWNTATNAVALRQWAARYVPPKKSKPKVQYGNQNRNGGNDAAAIMAGVRDGLAVKIFREGPLENGDRSTTLMKLAHRLHGAGVTASDAFTVLMDADDRWGKYHDRPDGPEGYIRDIIERTY